MPTSLPKNPLTFITNFVAAGFPPMSSAYTTAERLARGVIIAQLQNLVSAAASQNAAIDTTAFDQAAETALHSLNVPADYSNIDSNTQAMFDAATALVTAAGGGSHAIPIHIFPLPSPVGSSGSTTTSSSSTPSNTGTIIAVVAGVVGISAIALLAYKMKQQPPKRISKRH